MDQNRLRKEIEDLKRLEAASSGVVAIAASPNLRHYDITLRVPAPVGTDEHYTVEREHQLRLDLQDDFPASGPICRFSRPILVPNIWEDGTVCIVEHAWMPEQHLDQVVCDIIEEMQGLEPNYESVANPVAGRLYLRPEFRAELRRRLGPPVRLAPPPRQMARPGISTVGAPSPGMSRAPGIQTLGRACAPSRGITTVR